MGVKPQSGRYSASTETETVCPEGFTLLIYDSHRVRYMFLCGVMQTELDNPFKTFFHHWKSSSPHFLYKVIFLFCFGESQDRKGDKATQTICIWRVRSCPWALLLNGARQGAKPTGSQLVLFHRIWEMLSSVVLVFIPILHFQGCKRKYFKSLTNNTL